MLEVLHERSFPADEVVAFASERSAGRSIRFGDGSLAVVPLDDETIQGFDIALFSAGSKVSEEWAPRFADAGAVVVDNSSQWRMHDDVPLVVSEVNPDALDGHRGIVANPNCTTMVCMLPLKALDRAFGLEAIVPTSFQAAGGAGQKGMDELYAQFPALQGFERLLTRDDQLRSWPVSAGTQSPDQPSQVWLGTYGNGLFKVDPYFNTSEHLAFGLLDRGAGAVALAADGVWAAGIGDASSRGRGGLTFISEDLQEWRWVEGALAQPLAGATKTFENCFGPSGVWNASQRESGDHATSRSEMNGGRSR
jgi:hypothetical protein